MSFEYEINAKKFNSTLPFVKKKRKKTEKTGLTIVMPSIVGLTR